MSVDFVGEMVHTKKNRNTGQFIREKNGNGYSSLGFHMRNTHKQRLSYTHTETLAGLIILLFLRFEVTRYPHFFLGLYVESSGFLLSVVSYINQHSIGY